MDTTEPKARRFEDSLDFPAAYTFRVVSDADEAICTLCVAVITEMLSRAPSRVVCQPSRSGTFAVYRITATVDAAEQIRAIYDTLIDVEGVRTLL